MPKRAMVDFPALRGRLKPIQALNLIDWRYVTRFGETYRGPCPIHRSTDERSRIFSVTDRVCFCHKCHVGGDAVRLWALLTEQDDYRAAQDLCQRLGIPIPML